MLKDRSLPNIAVYALEQKAILSTVLTRLYRLRAQPFICDRHSDELLDLQRGKLADVDFDSSPIQRPQRSKAGAAKAIS